MYQISNCSFRTWRTYSLLIGSFCIRFCYHHSRGEIWCRAPYFLYPPGPWTRYLDHWAQTQFCHPVLIRLRTSCCKSQHWFVPSTFSWNKVLQDNRLVFVGIFGTLYIWRISGSAGIMSTIRSQFR